MLTLQGKIVAHGTMTMKESKEELQTISVYFSTTNFGKKEPVIEKVFVPMKYQGLDTCIEKEVILPVSMYAKGNKINYTFPDDGRAIKVKNDKGQFEALPVRGLDTGKVSSISGNKTG